MTKTRLDSLYLILLGCVIFVSLGGAGVKTSAAAMQDFKVLYYPARCLLQGCDPYNEDAVTVIYLAEAGQQTPVSGNMRLFATRYIYFPTAFPITVPFAMLSLRIAETLWMILTIGFFILASFLIWDIGANKSPLISGCLIGYLVANSEVLLILGNAAGLAVSLCAISVWCFHRNRFALTGVICLATSLAIKPQDAGLVWLYFLMAGGIHRKRALQTLVSILIITLPALLWTWHNSPDWWREWHSNVAAFSAHGGLTDPGPDSANGYGLSMMVNLQSIFANIWDNPSFYNFASYLVFAPLFFLWTLSSLRRSFTQRRHWLALAIAAVLTMLPVYHRLNDAKLLILTVPACAMLWAEGGRLRWFTVLLNSAAFVLCGDLPWIAMMGIVGHFHFSSQSHSEQILRAIFVYPSPLILLALATFYVWVYVFNEPPQFEQSLDFSEAI